MIQLNGLIKETVVNPRSVAGKITSYKLDTLNIFQAALFVAICSTILTYFFVKILLNKISVNEMKSNPFLEELLLYITSIQPVVFSINQIIQMLLFSALITLGGKIFSGTAKFFDALLCVTWVEFILLIVKFFQIVLIPFSLIFPFLIMVLGIFWSLWAFASMAAAIHNFQSTFLTFIGGLGLGFLMLIFLNLFY